MAAAEEDVPAAAAAAVVVRDEDDGARQSLCWEQLTGWYGFDATVAAQALEAVLNSPQENKDGEEDGTASSTLLEACCRYILENEMDQDRGGPVTPIDHCPHLAQHCTIAISQLPRQPAHTVCSYTTNDNDDSRCTGTENWLCLECGVIRCSRYVHGHGLQDWQETATATATATTSSNSDEKKEAVSPQKLSSSATTTAETAVKSNTKNNPNSKNGTKGQDGHCLAVSLSDLSVWCHQCQAYVLVTSSQQAHLQTIVQTLEARKFSNNSAEAASSDDDGAEVASVFLESDEPAKKKHKSDSEMEDDDSSVEDSGCGE